MFFVNLQIFPYISNKDSQHDFIGQNILAADTRRQFKLFAWATCPGKSIDRIAKRLRFLPPQVAEAKFLRLSSDPEQRRRGAGG